MESGKINQNLMKRLMFIKYMYEKGVEQSLKSYPESQMSLLTFHDAIELFLIFSYVHLGGDKHINDIHFKNYWKEISKLPNGVELTQQPSVEKLNDARVNLKHRGNFTSHLDIEAFRATSTSFFNENTEKVFGTDFSDISLVGLVKNQEVKQNLKKAEEFLKDNKFDESINEISDAFYQIIHNHDKKIKDLLGYDNPFINCDLDYNINSPCDHGYDDDNGFSDVFLTNFENISISIDYLQETVKLMSWGINYYDYVKFRSIIPSVTHSKQGKLFEEEAQTGKNDKMEAKYCFDFVINMYLTLEELDLENMLKVD